MILVVGATGQLGGRIARMLLELGESVRALVRDPSTSGWLVEAGAEIVTGDLTDDDSLRRACAGVDAVVTTANSMARGGADTIESVDRAGNAALIAAAAAAGVRRFVFVSALGAALDHPVPFMRAKAETEQLLAESGMAWTVLQPDFYMEMLPVAVVGAPALAGQPVTLIGEGRRRHSLVSMDDVAAYAVAVLDRADAEERTIALGGPEPLSWRDVVAEFQRALEHDVPVRTVPIGAAAPGMPDMLTGLLTALEAYDSPLDMTELAAQYGVVPTPLSTFVRSFVAEQSVPH